MEQAIISALGTPDEPAVMVEKVNYVNHSDYDPSRLKAFRTYFSISQAGLAKKIGINYSYIAKIEQGVRPLRKDIVYSICMAYGCNEEWFRTGEGELSSTPAVNYDEVRNRLESLRGELTLVNFAYKIGCSVSQVSKVMSGENNPSREMLRKAANAYNVSYTWLLYGKDIDDVEGDMEVIDNWLRKNPKERKALAEKIRNSSSNSATP